MTARSAAASRAAARLAVAVSVACHAVGARAAADGDGPTVSNTRTPDAPAFVLLGVSPTQVERPTQVSALAVSVLSAAASSDNLVPQSYALQVAPYWLVSHPGLSSDKYFNPSMPQGILDTLSFSLVSSRVSTVAGQHANATRIGVGVRTGLIVGHESVALRKQILKLHALQYENNVAMGVLEPYLLTEPPPPDADDDGRTLSAAIAEIKSAFDEAIQSNDPPGQQQAYREAEKRLIKEMTDLWADAHRPAEHRALRDGANAMQSRIEAQLTSAVKKIQIADDDRRGFSMSFAAASAWLVPDQTTADRTLLRWGAWMTPSYRPDTAPIELIGVVRAGHRPDAGGVTMIDVGGRATHQVGLLNWSLEYVQRVERSAILDQSTSQRLAAVFDVRVRDDVYVTVNYGKDFADPTRGDTKGGILTSLGLSFDFGDKPSVSLK